MNKKMTKLLENTEFNQKKLPPQLSNLIEQGFYENEGCIFIKSLFEKKTNANSANFPDKTGYECFINSIHVDDYAPSDHLAIACFFVDCIFREWRFRAQRKSLRAIIFCDEISTSIKLHLIRDGESWISSDLEGYEDAILALDSDVYISSIFPLFND